MNGLVQKTSIRATLINMGIGETMGIAADVVASGTLRSVASTLSFELARRYSVHTNREKRIYEVTRHE